MLETGIKGHKEQSVTDELTAAHIGSGLVRVFATPMMIALMESTCAESVAAHLEAGQGTVGTHVNVSHCAATVTLKSVSARSNLPFASSARPRRYRA